MKSSKVTVIGTEEYREFFRDGLHHRIDGPAFTILDLGTGVVVFEAYFRYGLMHRDHGPAHVERSPEGRITLESYFFHGSLHRLNGPAVVARSAINGDILHSVWALSGKEYADESAWRRDAQHLNSALRLQ